MKTALLMCGVVGAIGLAGYLAACAGAQRWLTFKQWWSTKP